MLIRTTAMLCTVAALAACTNPAGDLNPEYLAPGGGTVGVLGPDVSATALAPTSPEYFTQTVGDRVLFEVDQYILTTVGKSILAGQAQWLRDNPTYMVVVEGHADEQGTREYNLALGARRARSVQEYLVTLGVPSTRIQTRSFGKERPLAICSDESCYGKNRRAVTVLAGGVS